MSLPTSTSWCGFVRLPQSVAGCVMRCLLAVGTGLVLAGASHAAMMPASTLPSESPAPTLATPAPPMAGPIEAAPDHGGDLRDLARDLAAPRPTAESSRPVRAAAPSTASLPLPIPANERQPLGSGSPTKGTGDATTSTSWWLSTALALGAVIAVIFVLRAVIQKWSGTTPTSAGSPVVEVLTRVPVAPKNHILLVRLGGRILVLGDGPQGLRTLSDLHEPEEVAELLTAISAARSQSVTTSFNHLVRSLGGQTDDPSVTDEGQDAGEYHLDAARERVSSLMMRLRSLTGGGR